MLLGRRWHSAVRCPIVCVALLACALLPVTLAVLPNGNAQPEHISVSLTPVAPHDEPHELSGLEADIQRRGLGLGMLSNIIPPAIASLVPGPASSLAAKITNDLAGVLPTAILPTLIPTTGLPLPSGGLPPLTAGLPLPSGAPLLSNIAPSLPISAQASLPTADAILGLGNKLGGLLGNLIPFAANSIVQAVTSQAAALLSEVQVVATDVAALANHVSADQLPVLDALDAVGNLVKGLDSVIGGIVQDVTSNITDILPAPVLDQVIADVKGTLGDVVAIADGPIDILGDLIENNVCGLVTAVDGVLQTVAGFCGQMDSAVSAATQTSAPAPNTSGSVSATATPTNTGNITPLSSTGASAVPSDSSSQAPGAGLSPTVPDFTGLPNTSGDSSSSLAQPSDSTAATSNTNVTSPLATGTPGLSTSDIPAVAELSTSLSPNSDHGISSQPTTNSPVSSEGPGSTVADPSSLPTATALSCPPIQNCGTSGGSTSTTTVYVPATCPSTTTTSEPSPVGAGPCPQYGYTCDKCLDGWFCPPQQTPAQPAPCGYGWPCAHCEGGWFCAPLPTQAPSQCSGSADQFSTGLTITTDPTLPLTSTSFTVSTLEPETQLPVPAPTHPIQASEWGYCGCWADQPHQPALAAVANNLLFMTNPTCVKHCISLGYLMAATSGGNACHCGNFLNGTQLLNDSQCNSPCRDDQTEACGGEWALSCYSPSGEPYGWASVGPEPLKPTLAPPEMAELNTGGVAITCITTPFIIFPGDGQITERAVTTRQPLGDFPDEAGPITPSPISSSNVGSEPGSLASPPGTPLIQGSDSVMSTTGPSIGQTVTLPPTAGSSTPPVGLSSGGIPSTSSPDEGGGVAPGQGSQSSGISSTSSQQPSDQPVSSSKFTGVSPSPSSSTSPGGNQPVNTQSTPSGGIITSTSSGGESTGSGEPSNPATSLPSPLGDNGSELTPGQSNPTISAGPLTSDGNSCSAGAAGTCPTPSPGITGSSQITNPSANTSSSSGFTNTGEDFSSKPAITSVPGTTDSTTSAPNGSSADPDEGGSVAPGQGSITSTISSEQSTTSLRSSTPPLQPSNVSIPGVNQSTSGTGSDSTTSGAPGPSMTQPGSSVSGSPSIGSATPSMSGGTGQPSSSTPPTSAGSSAGLSSITFPGSGISTQTILVGPSNFPVTSTPSTVSASGASSSGLTLVSSTSAPQQVGTVAPGQLSETSQTFASVELPSQPSLVSADSTSVSVSTTLSTPGSGPLGVSQPGVSGPTSAPPVAGSLTTAPGAGTLEAPEPGETPDFTLPPGVIPYGNVANLPTTFRKIVV
ncbi:WSC domain-containing protein [Microdochium nivale]|nr:WSC domain-containing protein [Microdochium nivale]